MYSQNNEEEIILSYFRNHDPQKCTFLDIGAYDGIDLSNTRALAERGWAGVVVEPHPEIAKALLSNYADFSRVSVMPYAVATSCGRVVLQANDTYYSTIKNSEIDRWNGQFDFKPIEVGCVDFATLQDMVHCSHFDFISIDCEGMDYEVLSQIDLNAMGCQMVCVETNGKETQKYIDYIKQFGVWDVALLNAENLIMFRNYAL